MRLIKFKRGGLASYKQCGLEIDVSDVRSIFKRQLRTYETGPGRSVWSRRCAAFFPGLGNVPFEKEMRNNERNRWRAFYLLKTWVYCDLWYDIKQKFSVSRSLLEGVVETGQTRIINLNPPRLRLLLCIIINYDRRA